MKPELIIATGNMGKMMEISTMLTDLPYLIRSYQDFPNLELGEEDGDTYLENALRKAKPVFDRLNTLVLSDDTGLEVAALGGRPGLYAARYAGEGCSYLDNMQKLLEELKDVPMEKRQVIFRTVMVLFRPGQQPFVAEGVLEGYITKTIIGHEGFGYDPVFFVPEKNKTLAEMTLDEKNQISHRRRALIKIKDYLSKSYQHKVSPENL